MIYSKKYFIYSPGGENENNTGSSVKKEEQKKDDEQTSKNTEEHKPIIEKIKDALQEWSNDDQSDLEFDDTRV